MPAKRSYLVPFDTAKLPSETTDVLVIGGGVAGLRAAIEAVRYGRVTVLTKDTIRENNTYYAQGGIAAHITGDNPSRIDSHIKDTLDTGHHLSDPAVVRYIIKSGIRLVRELADWGMRFDRRPARTSRCGVGTGGGTEVDFAREGGHSRARIVHAGGDATGQKLLDTLINKVRLNNNIKVVDHVFVIDLLTTEPQSRQERDKLRSGRNIGADSRKPACCGALVYNRLDDKLVVIRAKNVILATGGLGQVYRETTNSAIATGDGIAMAYRAGAILQDMEFIQFHPTAFYVAGASRALISEAVRGEGAIIRDKLGYRFMPDYHPRAELAPRDVVARSIINQMKLTNDTSVYLDLTHLPLRKIKERFPGLAGLCRRFDIDIRRDYIPIRPSAHYMVGGVRTDINGRTCIHNLFAAGECASVGFHGANRLGSNSLLEGLVMGYTVGKVAGRESIRRKLQPCHIKYQYRRCRWQVDHDPAQAGRGRPAAAGMDSINLTDVDNALKSLMWHNVGLERNALGLKQALERIQFWSGYVMDTVFDLPAGWELQNMLMLSYLITISALRRNESRGTHYRSDFPQTDRLLNRHMIISATQPL